MNPLFSLYQITVVNRKILAWEWICISNRVIKWQAELVLIVHKNYLWKLTHDVFGYSWTNRWNFLSFNIWIFSYNLFVVKERAKFWFQFYNKCTLLVSLSKSVQFGDLYRKLHNRNWRNSMKKSRIKSSCVSLECIIPI